MADASDNEESTRLPLSPEAREFYERSFLPRYRELLDRVNRTPLAVLVWGPGPSGGDLYLKRVQIINALRAVGVTALFSEDIDEDQPQPGISARDRELAQALAADCIVALAASPGALAEVHDFAGFTTDIAPKMLVFLDRRHAQGYSAQGSLQDLQNLYGNVETYRYPDDIRRCSLLGKVEDKVGVLRRAKWRASLG